MPHQETPEKAVSRRQQFEALLHDERLFGIPKLLETPDDGDGHRRDLELLRQRMADYRAQRPWPVSDAVRAQLAQVFDLLVDFAREQPDHYHAIRCELANWVLLEDDRELARAADRRKEIAVRLALGASRRALVAAAASRGTSSTAFGNTKLVTGAMAASVSRVTPSPSTSSRRLVRTVRAINASRAPS